jgi:hypothetical protein
LVENVAQKRSPQGVFAEAVDHYMRRGYWIGRDIVPADEVLAARTEIHKVFLQQLGYLGLPLSVRRGEEGMHEDMTTLLRADKERYLASLRLCPKLVSVHRLFLSEGIQRFMDEMGISMPVFQTAPVFHVMSEDLRIPGGYYGLPCSSGLAALQAAWTLRRSGFRLSKWTKQIIPSTSFPR